VDLGDAVVVGHVKHAILPDGDHTYPLVPLPLELAVRYILLPLHIVSKCGITVTVGMGFTCRVVFAESEQLPFDATIV
jgi:hypothetical protein